MNIIIYLFLITLLCFIWRVFFILPFPHSGNDGFYFRLCVKEFKKKPTLKFNLKKHYLLEYDIQRYPPLFAVFLAVLPKKILDEYYWLITPFIDSLLCMLICLSVFIYTGNIESTLLCAILYTFLFSAHNEAMYLTSRSFGALLFFLTCIFGLIYITSGTLIFLLISGIFGALLLLAHRFTTQAFIISFILGSFFSYRYFNVLVTSFLLALIISRGFYLKVFLCNIDFIRFWNKHSHGNGCHQIYDSPAYVQQPKFKNCVYKKGFMSHIKYEINYLIQNMFILFNLYIVYHYNFIEKVDLIVYFSSLLALLIYSIGIISYHIKLFRGIGYGAQYGKLSMPIGLFSIGLFWIRLIPFFNKGLLTISLLTLFFAIYYLVKFLFTFETQKKTAISKWDFEKLNPFIEYVRNNNVSLLMCLSGSYNDLFTYYADIPVLWGNHSSPTDKWGIVLPYFKSRIEDISKKYRVSHIFIDKRYVSLDFINLNYDIGLETEHFIIFKV